MKPTIKKSQRMWELRYKYPPRMMWLFGATTEEREKIKNRCIKTVICESLEDALDSLKTAYKNREVVKL